MIHDRTLARFLLARLAIVAMVWRLLASVAVAAEEPTAVPAQFRSQHFLLYTDLAEAESQDLLNRLETMLTLISTYWGRPCDGVIECFIVKDLARWPDGAIPETGLAHIQRGAGVTVTATLSQGSQRLSKAVVYAVADRGTPQHEAVHAYCGQTFGATGPTWYSEGMAEMGQYWRKGESSVKIDGAVLSYLKETPPKTLNDIVNGVEFTGDSWQNYAWRWALCHLLANNANYASRFRPLGLGLLTNKPVSFEQTYGDMADQISFEYLFFLKHLEQGFRADLCSWDWKRKFRRLEGRSTISAKVQAKRGWQPSGAIVAAGQTFELRAAGQWRTKDKGTAVDGSGAEGGAGRLMGVVLDGMQLSEPFELGAQGEFTAPTGGKLYLRCQDAWGEIADNDGAVTVKLKALGKAKSVSKAESKERSEPKSEQSP